jgi:hypothetical protein
MHLLVFLNARRVDKHCWALANIFIDEDAPQTSPRSPVLSVLTSSPMKHLVASKSPCHYGKEPSHIKPKAWKSSTLFPHNHLISSFDVNPSKYTIRMCCWPFSDVSLEKGTHERKRRRNMPRYELWPGYQYRYPCQPGRLPPGGQVPVSEVSNHLLFQRCRPLLLVFHQSLLYQDDNYEGLQRLQLSFKSPSL